MAGQVYGVDFRSGSVDLRRLSEGEWLSYEVRGDSSNVKNVFVAAAQVEVNGEQVSLQSNGLSDVAGFTPQVWFLPTGEFQPFRMIAKEGGLEVALDAKLGQSVKVTFND